MRLTIFVPATSEQLLYQIARYQWDGGRKVSEIAIRFGVGDVGKAFTTGSSKSIPTVEDFSQCLAEEGFTSKEIEIHRRKDRRSFYSLPLTDFSEMKVVGVLSIDAGIENILSQLWDDTLVIRIIHDFLVEELCALRS